MSAPPGRLFVACVAHAGWLFSRAESTDPATRAVLWQPGAQGSSPPPVITAPAGGDTSTLLGPDAAIEHPGIFQLAPESAGIDHEEFFKWELNGYLVVPGKLSPFTFHSQ